MNSDLVLRARRVIRADGEVAGAVAVSGGRITGIHPYDAELSAGRTVEVPADCVLMPGLVDTHVHVNEPGRTEWEGFASATRAAAAGGVTTILDMPLNSVPPTVEVAALRAKRLAAAGQCHVDVGFWGGAVPGNLDELAPLHDAGVFGFKCFLLDSGVEEFPPLDPDDLQTYLRRIAELGAPVLVHAEDADSIERAPAAHGSSYRDFLTSRPREAENRAIDRVIDAARRTGARAHIVHLSSSDALPNIAAAKAEGVRLTVETCPHYLVFDAGSVPDGATEFKCCPPIREAGNRELLWRALADGLIDFVVSDHSPCTPELKQPGDFGAAWGGIASVQLSLPAVWTHAAQRGFSLTDVAGWMAEKPAAFSGLSAKGRIEAGRDADFTVLAPEEEFVVEAIRLHQRNPVTPYDGRSLRGVVRSTWLRGREISFDEPAGRLLVGHLAGQRVLRQGAPH